MKTLIQTFLFFFFLNSVFAQHNSQCCEIDQSVIIPQLLKNKAFLKANGQSKKLVDYYIPVVLQLIGDENGNRRLRDEDAYNFLCQLNGHFEAGDITFYLKELIHIDDDSLFNYFPLRSDDPLIVPFKKDSAINIFIVDQIDLTGLPSIEVAFSNLDFLAMTNRVIDRVPEFFIHQLGHHLGLLNTNYGWVEFSPDPFDPPWIMAPPTDLFGRPTEYMDGTNCDVGGDLICDTPPDYFRFSGVFSNCEYIDSLMDPAGVLIEPMINNFMANTRGCDHYEFTQGQFDLIKADLENNGRDIIYQNTAPGTIDTPIRPQPLFPANVVTPIVANQVFFDWEDDPPVATYILEISTNRFFGSIIQTISTTASEAFVEGLEPKKEYHWRVTAVSSSGCSSVSSEVSFETSDEISSTETKSDEESFSVFPNPVKENFIYGKFNSTKTQQIEIQLFLNNGKLVYSQTEFFIQGKNVFSIPISDFPSGTYFLKMKATDGFINKKITIIR